MGAIKLAHSSEKFRGNIMASIKQMKRVNKAVIVTDSLRSISVGSQARPAMMGFYGEMLALKHLQFLGLNATYTGSNGVGYDILVEDTLKVEVKTARQGKNGKWLFALTKSSTDVKRFQDINKSDLVLLQCVVECGEVITFAVPTTILANNKYIRITSNPKTYNGKLAKYRVA